MFARFVAPIVVLSAVTGSAVAQQPARVPQSSSQHRHPHDGNGGFVWPPVYRPYPTRGWGYKPVPVVSPPVFLGRYYPPVYGSPGYGFPPVYGFVGYGVRR